MKTLGDCQDELEQIERNFNHRIAEILKEQTALLTEEFQREVIRILEENNLDYVGIQGSSVSTEEIQETKDYFNSNFESEKEDNPKLTRKEFLAASIKEDVEMYINNTFIETAIDQDPSTDWDDEVRCCRFFRKLFAKE